MKNSRTTLNGVDYHLEPRDKDKVGCQGCVAQYENQLCDDLPMTCFQYGAMIWKPVKIINKGANHA